MWCSERQLLIQSLSCIVDNDEERSDNDRVAINLILDKACQHWLIRGLKNVMESCSISVISHFD